MTDHNQPGEISPEAQRFNHWGLDHKYWSDPEHVHYHAQIAYTLGQLFDALSAETVVFDDPEIYQLLWQLEGLLMLIGHREAPGDWYLEAPK